MTARAAGYRRLAGRPAAELMRDALERQRAAPRGRHRDLERARRTGLAPPPLPGVELLPGADAFDATEIGPGDRVVLVGAFIPFLKELKRRRQPYLVLEQNPAALKPEEMPFYRPADFRPKSYPAPMCC